MGIATRCNRAAAGKSNPNRHYGTDGSYNLYTKNETDAVMKFYTEVAATALGGPALKALGKAVIGVGSKLLPAAVNMLSKTSVAVNATATRGAVYLGSSSGTAYVAGGVEGAVKSYFGGPDVEFGSSIFGNPMSDAGLTTSSFLWATYNSEK